MIDDDDETPGAHNESQDNTDQPNDELAEGEMELTEEVPGDPAIAYEPGFHVYTNGEHNSGPYLTHDNAQSFIDQHLGGEGEIREVN